MTTTTIAQQDFGFRKNKEGYKRPTVSLEIPVLTQEGVGELLVSEDPKVVSLLVDLVNDQVKQHIRTFVEADENFSQETLNALLAEGKISIEAIANLPRSERNTIGKEDLEEFAKAYCAIMPEATGKDIKKVQMAAGLFVERFKRVAGDNNILKVLQGQLATFVDAASPEVLEANERTVTYLSNKLEELLSLEVSADAL